MSKTKSPPEAGRILNFPRRAMRPPAEMDELPGECAWCSQKIGRGVVFSRGKHLGKDSIVCPGCLTPPKIGSDLVELMEGDR